MGRGQPMNSGVSIVEEPPARGRARRFYVVERGGFSPLQPLVVAPDVRKGILGNVRTLRLDPTGRKNPAQG